MNSAKALLIDTMNQVSQADIPTDVRNQELSALHELKGALDQLEIAEEQGQAPKGSRTQVDRTALAIVRVTEKTKLLGILALGFAGQVLQTRAAIEQFLYTLPPMGLDWSEDDPIAQMGENENGEDDDHPLWLANACITSLLEGEGATEDHETVLAFLRGTGLPESTVIRMHHALVFGDSKTSDVQELRIARRKELQELQTTNHREAQQ